MNIELTTRERQTMAHFHIGVLDEQAKIYQSYMKNRFFTVDFPEKEENLYVINVVESIYEEVMDLDRAIAAPSGYEIVYEYIMMQKLRFGRTGSYYSRVQVYPIIYHPAPGDIVTLPAHLLSAAEKCDSRLSIPANWEMEVSDVTLDPSYSHEWKNQNKDKTPLLPERIKIVAPLLTVKPRYTGDPFDFPKIPMNHYILLHPAKEERKDDTIGD